MSRGRGGGDPFRRRSRRVADLRVDADDPAWLAPRESTSVHVTLGSVDDAVVAACVVFDPERSVGVMRYASLEHAEAGSLRLLDDDTTAVVDRSSSENWEDRLAGGCWNCWTSAAEVRGPASANASLGASRHRRDASSARRRARALQARRAGGPRGAAAAEAPALHREGRRRDRRERRRRGVRVQAQAAPRGHAKVVARESRAAHDEDLRRADRRFEEEEKDYRGVERREGGPTSGGWTTPILRGLYWRRSLGAAT